MDNTQHMAELRAKLNALHAAVRALYAYAPPDAQALLLEIAQAMQDDPQPHSPPAQHLGSIGAEFLRGLLLPNAE